jgi:hypothetical protein
MISSSSTTPKPLNLHLTILRFDLNLFLDRR